MGRYDEVKIRRRWMWAGIAVQLLVLFFFKYTEPIASALTGLSPSSNNYAFVRIILPIGISFYTFQDKLLYFSSIKLSIRYLLWIPQGRETLGIFCGILDLFSTIDFRPHRAFGKFFKTTSSAIPKS